MELYLLIALVVAAAIAGIPFIRVVVKLATDLEQTSLLMAQWGTRKKAR